MRLANRDVARDHFEDCVAEGKEGFLQTNRDISGALSTGLKGLMNCLAVPSSQHK